FSFSGTNCSMAAGLPYAIGAQTAYPDRQVVVLTGDGSMTTGVRGQHGADGLREVRGGVRSLRGPCREAGGVW
ncbi:MAG: thiamine pyrophosphate-dependent enzyme, partial [Nocardioidaceae bacterium]